MVLHCNTMEIVSIIFQKEILEKMDSFISEYSFNSRTEFVREAVRDKILDLSHEELLKEFIKYKGKSKIKTTIKQNRQTKEIVNKELMEYLEKRFK